MLESIVRVNLVKASGVDETENGIAELFFHLFGVMARNSLLQLSEFLLYFRPDILGFIPVETYATGFVLYAYGFDQEGREPGTPLKTVLLPSFSFSLICSQLRSTASGVSAFTSP